MLFSRGANNNIGKTYALTVTEVAELARIALDHHEAPVTRMVKVALRFLRQRSPGLRLVISYADPSCGHVGSIYQGGNWLYMGQSPASIEYVSPDGRQWHGRMVSKSGHTLVYGQTRNVWRHDQCRPVRVEGKHKYVMPLDVEMREKLKALSKPYPKRPSEKRCAGSVEGDASANHVEEGGSIPTPAL